LFSSHAYLIREVPKKKKEKEKEGDSPIYETPEVSSKKKKIFQKKIVKNPSSILLLMFEFSCTPKDSVQ
jgi:hypothetical protein